MIDLYLEWFSDLSSSASGDIALSAGTDAVSQRICRRLLTNAGSYLWQSDYGASLGTFVGSPVDAGAIEAVIRSQLAQESDVPASPSPGVAVTVIDGANGIVSVDITYEDVSTLRPKLINVSNSLGQPA